MMRLNTLLKHWSCAVTFCVLLVGAHLAVADPDELINGLHQDAANAQFDTYFARFTNDAVFLGTDRAERWSVDAFKAYAKPIFDAGVGWRYEVVSRHWAGTGDVRWFDEVLWNDKYGYCRGTGVIRSTHEGWRIAHYSLTFLIPNELAVDMAAMKQAIDVRPQ